MMDEKEKQKSLRSYYAVISVAFGVGVGAAIGVALDNIAIGVVIGAGIGVALGTAFSIHVRRRDDV